MKTIPPVLLSYLFIMSLSFVKAQDSIYLINNTKISAKIIEIGENHIKYNRYGSLFDTLYSVNKDVITLLKFSNGIIDSVKTFSTSAPIIITFAVKKENINSKILIEKNGRLRYMGIILRDRDIQNLIEQQENLHNKALLNIEYEKMIGFKRNKRIVAPILLITGFAVVVVPFVSLASGEFIAKGLNSSESINLALTSIIGGALIRITSCVISKVNSNKQKNQRKHLAILYNEFN